jgi:hypothetical protein
MDKQKHEKESLNPITSILESQKIQGVESGITILLIILGNTWARVIGVIWFIILFKKNFRVIKKLVILKYEDYNQYINNHIGISLTGIIQTTLGIIVLVIIIFILIHVIPLIPTSPFITMYVFIKSFCLSAFLFIQKNIKIIINIMTNKDDIFYYTYNLLFTLILLIMFIITLLATKIHNLKKELKITKKNIQVISDFEDNFTLLFDAYLDWIKVCNSVLDGETKEFLEKCEPINIENSKIIIGYPLKEKLPSSSTFYGPSFNFKKNPKYQFVKVEPHILAKVKYFYIREHEAIKSS